jgi:hypothetical protein
MDKARSTVSLNADGDSPGTTVRVNLDTVTTGYYGVGSGTAILRGSAGFGELRVGDRVQVSGTGRSNQTIDGDEVLLLGRRTEVTATGSAAPQTTTASNTIEGVVRSLNAGDNRLVVETDRRDLYTVYGSASTPVYFGGETFRIANIEVGDRIRVQYESRTSDGVRARIIDVVQDATPDRNDGRTLTSVTGRITRIDPRTQTMRVDISRGREIRVDLQGARGADGRTFRITDLQVGDRVELSGTYQSTDLFRASTVRFAGKDGRWDRNDDPVIRDDDPLDRDDDDDDNDDERTFETVVIYGTVRRALQAGDALEIRDSSNDREYEVHVVDDFIVRLKSGSYGTADQLKEGDRVVIQAFREDDDQLIAQTIRTR